MRNRPAFRPEVTGLEGRTALSTFAHPPGAVAAYQAAAPSPYNRIMTRAEWTSLHRENVGHAAHDGARVVFLGDSITYLWTAAGATPQTSEIRGRFFAPRGTAAWNEFLAPLGAANLGIPGDNTGNLLWRIGNGEAQGGPKVAVVLIGLNDLLQGATPAQAASGVTADVRALQSASPGTRVLVLGLAPPGTAPPGSKLYNEVDQTNDLLQAWCASTATPFLDLAPYLAGRVDAAGHPLPSGYRVAASALRGPLTWMLNEAPG